MKVYSVLMEVRVVVRAENEQEAILTATEPNKIAERLESIQVVKGYCPATGEKFGSYSVQKAHRPK